MPSYSKKSKLNLSTCHKDLQLIFNYVIHYWDVSIIWGHRGKDEQNNAWAKGYSLLRYPNSKHNRLPSLAVDVVPYPTLWDDKDKMIELGEFIKWFAKVLYDSGVIRNKIEWGGDWKKFKDYAHWQIADVPDPSKIKPGSMAAELLID